jgi:hypothetical protein
MSFGPRPNPSKEPSVKAGTADIMEQTCDLILDESSGRVSKVVRHSRTHAGRAQGMWSIIPSDDPLGMSGVRNIVETQQRRGQGPRYQERSRIGRRC